jgi:hypothetical protein
MDLITGGNYIEKGYYYKFYLVLPFYKTYTCKNLLNKEHKVSKLSLETGFSLTSNPNYVNFLIILVGFGLGLEINIREEVIK